MNETNQSKVKTFPWHRFGASDVELQASEVKYEGFCRVVKHTVRYKQFATEKPGGSVTRECVHRPPAATVLPYDPWSDQVVLIEQFRIGAYLAKQEPWVLEVVAGLLDQANETVEQCATRELQEEAGLTALELIPIYHYLVSCGSTNQHQYLFVAIVHSESAPALGGLAAENEDICIHRVGADQLFNLLDHKELNTASLIIFAQWLAAHRKQLRERFVAPS